MENQMNSSTFILGLDAPYNMDTKSLCYRPYAITTNGMWQNQNPLEYSLPILILQLLIIVLTMEATVFVLKFLGQPKVIAQIIGGVLLGPSGLGHMRVFGKAIFPLRSIMVVEAMAKIGLLYFMFLVGLEVDFNVVKRASRHAILTAIAGLVLPLLVAFSIALFYSSRFGGNGAYFWGFSIFYCVILSITAFPVLARLIIDLKLFNTQLARVSTSVAVVNDMFAWTLLTIAIIWNRILNAFNPYLIIFGSLTFVLFCFVVLRPSIMWIIRRHSPEGENLSEFYICLIHTGVIICGLITDALGTHFVFGSFIFGLIIPNGPLGNALLEKLKDFVTGVLLPLYFAMSGLRTNLASILDVAAATYLCSIVLATSITKLIITSLIALLHDMQFPEAISLGLLMNTKGLMEIIIIDIAKDMRIVNNQAYASIVLITIVMTAITAPAIEMIFRASKHFTSHKRRTIQKLKMDKELKMVVCVYTRRNVPTMINLLEVSHATLKSPIHICALHLVELTSSASASAMLIKHTARMASHGSKNNSKTQTEQIFDTFENYAQHTRYVTIQPLTAISPYSTMHEDICNIAENNQTTLVIVPFHKQQTVDGGMELTNPSMRSINQNVLANAPCSVGILIDRGFGGSVSHTSHHVLVIFIGGSDDREALAYGWRMVEHPGVSLMVMRFIERNTINEQKVQPPQEEKFITTIIDNQREKQIDDEYIGDFRLKTVIQDKIVYKEKVVNNAVETLAAIRSMDNIHDLYIVGRRQSIESPITAGLNDFSECPELGAIGDFLASSDFARTVSVLVVQQYTGERIHGNDSTTTTSPIESINQYDNVQTNQNDNVRTNNQMIQQTL